MAIEIVDFPIKNGDFPVRYVSHYQRVMGHSQTAQLGSLVTSHQSARPRYSDDDPWPKTGWGKMHQGLVKEGLFFSTEKSNQYHFHGFHHIFFFSGELMLVIYIYIYIIHGFNHVQSIWNFQLVEALCQNKSHGFQLLRMPRKFAAWWMWPCPIPQCKTCPRRPKPSETGTEMR